MLTLECDNDRQVLIIALTSMYNVSNNSLSREIRRLSWK